MNRNLKLVLVIGIPVIAIGTIGLVAYKENEKRKKALADFIAQNQSSSETVTYTDSAGNTVTKPKNQVSVQDLVNAGKLALNAWDKISGLFNKDEPAMPTY